jgi:DNA-binding NarL/FixJ family response regulator
MLKDYLWIRATRIVIVDRNEVTRKGLQGIIHDADESYEILATFAHFDEIDPFIEGQPIDVMVIDDAVFDPPQIVRLIDRYHDTQPRIGITILSQRNDGDYIRRVMRYGSAGFIVKSNNLSEQLLIAVKLAAEKYPFISSDAAKLLDNQIDRSLKHRDQDVFRLLERELSVKEIAAASVD